MQQVSIGMVGRGISTPLLKSLRILHIEPINVVVFHEPWSSLHKYSDIAKL